MDISKLFHSRPIQIEQLLHLVCKKKMKFHFVAKAAFSYHKVNIILLYLSWAKLLNNHSLISNFFCFDTVFHRRKCTNMRISTEKIVFSVNKYFVTNVMKFNGLTIFRQYSNRCLVTHWWLKYIAYNLYNTAAIDYAISNIWSIIVIKIESKYLNFFSLIKH